MKIRGKISGTSQALDRLLAGQAEAARMLRRLPWGESILTIIGASDSLPACLAAQYAFEWLAGWPVVVREVSEFKANALQAIQPRTVIMAASYSGEEKEFSGIARLAANGGATLLAVTGAQNTLLAQMTNNVFAIQAGDEEAPKIRTPFLEHAALLWISVLAAKIFNPRQPQARKQEQGFRSLPERLDWIETHLLDAVHMLALKVSECDQLFVLGSGLCFPVALHAPLLARKITPLPVRTLAPAEVIPNFPTGPNRHDAFLFLSDSRSPAKHKMTGLVARITETPARRFSLTNSNDRPMIDACEMSILIPSMAEVPASLLELALLQWFLLEISEQDVHKASSPQTPNGPLH